MPGNILIVDDEPAIRQMLGFTLTGNGYSYREAGDVDEAHGALDHHPPDLILLDWMLPGLSGDRSIPQWSCRQAAGRAGCQKPGYFDFEPAISCGRATRPNASYDRFVTVS
jgi:CheY-like chemotaxis protein